SGLFLIAVGLAKKIVIGDTLAQNLVNRVFDNPERFSSLEVTVAVYAYAFQIYADFSGYTDVALGSAKLFGYELPKNFDRPYVAHNLQEFWHRWHISLSTWLRDYLYIPLGGSRHHRIRNVMITMLLGGLWHGASWNFVLWGALHGVLLIAGARLPRIAFWYALLLTWIAFRVRDFEQMLLAMKKFVLFDFDFSLAHRGLTGLYFFTTLALIAIFCAIPRDLDTRLARLPVAAQAAACVAIGATLALFWPVA